MTANELDISHLTLSIEHKTILQDIDLTIGAGETVALIGESGSGKSMTALALAGLLSRHDMKKTGEILFEGTDLLHSERSFLRGLQGNDISVVFQEAGNMMPLVAVWLIEKDPVQQEEGDSILTYTVKEALCDKNSVQVVVEVTAKERGKYLLAGQDTMNEDPVRNLGIESDKTIGEYAAEKGLIIVKVGASFDFDSDLGIETAVGDYRNLEDDVVDFYSSAVKTNESKNLTISCIGTATLPDAKCVDDVMRTNITFQLEDKSQGKSMTYVPVDGEGITAAGKVKILSADIEETEVGDYVTIHCIFLEECDSISLDVMDLNGNLWQLSDLGGGSEVAEVGKEATFQRSYQKTDLADEIGIRGYDYETNTTYEPVKMKLKK